jgi:hypothetical protein
MMTSAQDTKDLEMIRASFQEIQNEGDIQNILNFQIIDLEYEIANVIEAYQGASQCMIAKYVVAPWTKMKNFNAGKDRLEDSIAKNKVVENVYLRLMIQLSAPKLVNYNKDIDSDLQYLENHLVKTPMDLMTDLIKKKMPLPEGARDMVILQHDIIADYGENRKKERTISTLVDYGDPKAKFTAIAKTVGAPAAIAAKLILQGNLNLSGCHIPTHPEIYNIVLDELKTLGIKFSESTEIIN